MMKALIFLATILIPTWLLPGVARAHPHSWIDVRVTVQFNDRGEIAALRQHWLFDEFYSTFATDGLELDDNGLPNADSLQKLAQLNLKNLRDYNYFTLIRQNGETPAFGTPFDIGSQMQGDRLSLSFTLPFSAPQGIAGHALTYAIFDPSYYVEMLHAETGPAVTLEGAPEDCRFILEKPDPDPEILSFAASLDQTQSAGNDLGQSFAEKVIISCGQ